MEVRDGVKTPADEAAELLCLVIRPAQPSEHFPAIATVTRQNRGWADLEQKKFLVFRPINSDRHN